jgi:exodeoxyribonuclease VII small subunit
MNKKPKPSDEPEGKSFEHHLKQLEQIVQQLEAGQMDLSDSLKVFESGLQHLRSCHQRLREAEERIALVVDVNADGTARLKDIDESGKPASDRTRASKRGGGKDTDQLF